MQNSIAKLLIALLAACVISGFAGLASLHVAGLLGCNGERLACNIDEAIGGYGVLIWSVLGPLIYGIVLAVARNHTALLGAAILLLLPPLAFLTITQYEHTIYIGFEPDRQFRTLLVSVGPVVIVVLVQYLVLRSVLFRAPAATPA
jgi:hypothetical protein